MKRILFICTGNTCRSPLAEALLRHQAAEAGLTIEVQSAGVSAMDGMPVSEHSQTILRKKGITDQLTSTLLTAEHVDWADLILTMTMSHKRIVLERFPKAVAKSYALKEFTLNDLAITEIVNEREKLVANLQLKWSLNEPISEADKMRLAELDQQLPSYDVADPFGGMMEDYEATAEEIEAHIAEIIRRLQDE